MALPALPEVFVPRPRLLDVLDGDTRPALVCAPSGFGKTALLAHWARTTSGVGGVAWADLPAGAGRSLWPSVLAALSDCAAVPPDSALHRLAGLARVAPAPAADVLEALDALPVPLALVLHDVHGVELRAAQAGLEVLLAARPEILRVVACSQADPPLPWAALLTARRLVEVRADRLRYSADETRRVLLAGQVPLDDAQARELHRCTGGWPAGVRLATAVLCGGAEPEAFLHRLAARAEPVGDFLLGEVLRVLPDPDRRLLRAIDIGAPVTADRAAVLSGRSDAGAALVCLARDTGLVLPGPGALFRVHPLLGSYGGDTDVTGRRRSARAETRAPLPHAVRAEDPVELVRRFTGELLVTGGHAVLGRLLSRIPEQVVADDPWLAVCAELTRIETGLDRVPDLRPQLPATGPPPAGTPEGQVARLAVLRAVTEVSAAAAGADLGASPGPVDLARARGDSPEWTALALVAVGARAMLVDADPASAAAAFEEAQRLAHAQGFRYLEMQCHALLATVAGIGGDYPAMTAAAARAEAAVITGGWEASPLATSARWMLAYGALLRSEPVVAHRLAGEALRRTRPTLRPRYVYALRAVQGAALFDTGRRHHGLLRMQDARAALGAVELSREQATVLAMLEHQAATALGLAHAAEDVVTWLAARIGTPAEVLLMRSWAARADGRDHDARTLVGPVLDGSVTAVLPHTTIDALLVEASGRVTGGDVPAARRALRAALTSGASLDVVRPFALLGGEARELLVDHLGRNGSAGPFALRALAVGRPTDVRTGRLDDGERDVLIRLPSALSVDQIAAELHIPATEATARVRTVYRKLGVSSRRTAVTAAHERRLLD